MSHRTRRAGLLLAVTVLAAGCGSAAAGKVTGPAGPARQPSLATSLVTPTGTWAVAVMGGSAATHNDFWQLFVRPAGAGSWRVATPPGVASNGGLVIASLGPGSVIAGFRPSQDLSFSPLATTHDTGAAWSPGVLEAGLADVPDALAAAPGTGRLLALLAGGKAELSGPAGKAWTRLAIQRALAASTAGTRCGLAGLTAAAFSPSGMPLLAGSCTHPGTAGIFAGTGTAWHAAGPALPASYAHQNITVLRLTTTGDATMALLAAGTGTTARLLAASSTDNGAYWSLSQPLPLGGATLTSASFGPGGTAAVVLSGDHAQALTSTPGPWRPLPALPPGTATLAPGPAGGWDALAAHSTRLTVWQLASNARAWATTQTIDVPIQFGSSG
jgi:hypothetical protein